MDVIDLTPTPQGQLVDTCPCCHQAAPLFQLYGTRTPLCATCFRAFHG